MIPFVPPMSDELVAAFLGVAFSPLVVNPAVPLYQHIPDAEGLTRAIPIGYLLAPDGVNVHPERVALFHLCVTAAAMIHMAERGMRSIAAA